MKIRNFFKIVCPSMSLVLLSGCTVFSNENEKEENSAAYRKISAKEAKKIIDEEKDIIILDVRSKEEHNKEYIKNSLLLPCGDLEKNAEKILPDKDKKILVHCQSGARSRWAAKKLVELGYKNVLDFGGLMNWPYETESSEWKDSSVF